MLYTCIDHPAISCQDVKAQVDWYCRNFGMKIIFNDGKTPPSVLIGFGDGGGMIELMPVKNPGPPPVETPRFQPGLRHLALRVSDFKEAYQRLKELKVPFLFEPAPGVGGDMVVSFRDPEGNELQIVERKGK
jgi:catechol 2,3-dioxygenase-like lactoylglutathione lyase family enzyme